ncbi:DUF3188 domain-containing protein [Vagococcus fluvialis]|uniref:DUF3188 domain-containing protein n=1 Tax=Vagococcus fluvialis TaxID=2738 RepID=UPI003B21689B
MEKNGLLLVSIGLIVFVLSANARLGTYDFLSMITAFSLMAAGGFIYRKGKRKEA